MFVLACGNDGISFDAYNATSVSGQVRGFMLYFDLFLELLLLVLVCSRREFYSEELLVA